MTVPTGLVKTPLPGGNGGVTWEAVTQYDDLIHKHADPLGWSIEHIRATILIESRGVKTAHQVNPSNGDSYGLCQVVAFGVGWTGWYTLVAQKAGLSGTVKKQQIIDALYDPTINIAVGVQILENFWNQYGQDADKAASAFFLGNPNWTGGDSVNGTSGADYRRALAALKSEQRAFSPDIVARIVGGIPYGEIFGFNAYNGNSDGTCNHFYQYGVNHGAGGPNGNSDCYHTGIDIPVPLGTSVFTPLSGVVRCVGNTGVGDWGQGCGSFPDQITGGVGNVTVLTDVGLKLTFGHVNKSLVRVGDKVDAWQQVATTGGMVGPHLHLDVVEKRNGAYWLLDPIPALTPYVDGAAPSPYAKPVDIPQASEFEVWATVTALQDNIPFLQRADRGSASTRAPLKKGDTFDAVYQVIGNDKSIYWVARDSSRVPVDGTSSKGWAKSDTVCPPKPYKSLTKEEVEEVNQIIGTLDSSVARIQQVVTT